ncbi:MAG: FAD-dependent monooxygenase [Bacteroidia bacterium]|nr:FAD-dependent monooxygenase [Bacteroidia bacterium]
MKESEILIVGAGPTGIVAALCLAKLGISSTIVERNLGVNTHPKAHELNSRSIEILHALGITDEELSSEAAPFTDGSRILFCHSINEEYGRIDLQDDPQRREKYNTHLRSPTPYLNISQTALEIIIRDHAKANPLINLLYQHQWHSAEENDHEIISKVENLETNQNLLIKSAYVLGADGAGSRCRKHANISMTGPDKIDDFASAYFEANLRNFVKTPAKLYWILNPHAAGTFIAHHIEKRWVYMIPAYLQYQNKEDFTKSFFEEKIKTALGDPMIEIDVQSISFWRMSAQVANTYRKGRIILVGDAAHRFPPTGGLGMNTGIADAHNICWKLRAVINGQARPTLLDTYETERKPIADQNTKESLFNYHKIFEVPGVFGLDKNGLLKLNKFKYSAPTKWLPDKWKNKIVQWAQNAAERKMRKHYLDPMTKEKLSTAIKNQISHFDRLGLDIGYIYESGTVVSDGTAHPHPEDPVSEYIPSTRPGARFPYLALLGNMIHSTHDLLDYSQYTLLVRSTYNLWEETCFKLKKEMGLDIKVYQLDLLGISETDLEKFIDLCQIDESGLLIIRPDGHVAFRSKSGLECNTQNLKRIFAELGY